MKSLIFFALVASCVARSFIPDTPEVQAEKQRFYQLYNAAAAAAAAAPDIDVHHEVKPVSRNVIAFPHQQHQQQFVPQQFFSQFAHSPQTVQQPHIPQWRGPVASEIPAGLPGSSPNVRNTPEVEAAIAEFTRAYNAAVVNTGNAPGPRVANVFRSTNPAHFIQPQFRSHAEVATPRWTGPLASNIPAGLPGSSSQVGDTHDVQAAKAAFGRAFQQQLMAVLG